MKRCCEPECRAECYPSQKRCAMHWKRELRLQTKRRRFPKPVEHKRKMFDLARCGAVGWRVRS